MFTPTRKRLFYGFIFAVLLGVLFGVVKGQAASDEGCGSDEECYAIMLNPGFCDIVPKYGWWYYFAFCDKREGGAMAMSTTYDFQADGSVIVAVTAEDEHGHKSTHARQFRPRVR